MKDNSPGLRHDRERLSGTEYYIVTADYRPKNIKKPEYTFLTDKGKGFVRECFGKWYPWLTIYDIRETPENELSEEQRKWALTI